MKIFSSIFEAAEYLSEYQSLIITSIFLIGILYSIYFNKKDESQTPSQCNETFILAQISEIETIEDFNRSLSTSIEFPYVNHGQSALRLESVNPFDILNVLSKKKLCPNSETYNILMKMCIFARDLANADRLFSAITNSSTPICHFSVDTYSNYLGSYINALGIANSIEVDFFSYGNEDSRGLNRFSKTPILPHKVRIEEIKNDEIIILRAAHKVVEDLMKSKKTGLNSTILDLVTFSIYFSFDISLYAQACSAYKNSDSIPLKQIVNELISNQKKYGLDSFQQESLELISSILGYLEDYDFFAEILSENLRVEAEFFYNNDTNNIILDSIFDGQKKGTLTYFISCKILYYALLKSSSVVSIVKNSFIQDQLLKRLKQILSHYRNHDISSNQHLRRLNELAMSRICFATKILKHFFDKSKRSSTTIEADCDSEIMEELDNALENEVHNEAKKAASEIVMQEDDDESRNFLMGSTEVSNFCIIYHSFNDFFDSTFGKNSSFKIANDISESVFNKKFEEGRSIFDSFQTKLNIIMKSSPKGSTKAKKISSYFELVLNAGLHCLISEIKKDKFQSISKEISFSNFQFTKMQDVYEKSLKSFNNLKLLIDDLLNSGMIPKIMTSTHTLIIEFLFACDKTDEIREMYDKFKKGSLPLESVETEILLKQYFYGFCNINDCITSVSIIRLKESSIMRNSKFYTHLIKMYAYLNSEDKVLEKYEEMICSDLKPTIGVYCSLIDIFLKKKKFANAIGIFNDIKQNKLEFDEYPDLAVFESLIRFCISNEHEDKAMQLIQYMITNSNSLDTFNFTSELFLRLFNLLYSNRGTFRMSTINIITQGLLNLMKVNGIPILEVHYIKIGQLISKVMRPNINLGGPKLKNSIPNIKSNYKRQSIANSNPSKKENDDSSISKPKAIFLQKRNSVIYKQKKQRKDEQTQKRV